MSTSVLVVQEPIAQLVIAGDAPVALQVVEERVALLSVAEQGPSGPPGPAVGATLQRSALNVLSGHRAVIAVGELSADYPDIGADADAELVLGVTTGAAQAGAPVTVQFAGELVESSWQWTPGPVFCGPEGQLTQSPPLNVAWLRQVGVAVAPDRLLVQLRPPILL